MSDKTTFRKKIRTLNPFFRIPKDNFDYLKLKVGNFVDISIKKVNGQTEKKTSKYNCNQCGKRFIITVPPHLRHTYQEK